MPHIINMVLLPHINNRVLLPHINKMVLISHKNDMILMPHINKIALMPHVNKIARNPPIPLVIHSALIYISDQPAEPDATIIKVLLKMSNSGIITCAVMKIINGCINPCGAMVGIWH